MIWLKAYTDAIRAHLMKDDAASLTYAALEARLALERVCYERLKHSHKYLGPDDIRRWTPRYVVQTLMELVDPKIASEWTLSMSAEPSKDGVSADDPSVTYVPLGTQKGFDPAYVSTLWQAMSSFLHCPLPKSSDVTLSHYADAAKMRAKITAALKELDRLAEGTLIGAMVFKQVTFDCVCGQKNSRAEAAVQHNALIGCIKEGCKEQYRVERRENEFYFERNVIDVKCNNCGAPDRLPSRSINEMSKDQAAWFYCDKCGTKNTFMWRLMQRNKTNDDKSQA